MSGGSGVGSDESRGLVYPYASSFDEATSFPYGSFETRIALIASSSEGIWA